MTSSPLFATGAPVTAPECPRTGEEDRPFREGDQVKLTRMGGLGVAVAAGLATIASGLAPAVAQASAPAGGRAPAVTHYTGTPGVARLLPRRLPAAPVSAVPRRINKGARRLPSGHFSAAEAVPRAPA
jgi:hypothetical protein